MKSFIEYLTESKKKKEDKEKLPSFETVFGSHSKDKLPSFETVFGSHSKDEKKKETHKHHVKENVLLEEVTPTLEKQISKHSKEDETRLHKDNALPKMDFGEKTGVKYYTKGSRPLNSSLHNHYNKNTKPDSKNLEMIKRLDSILDKSKIKEDTHVFTGIPTSPVNNFKNGKNAKVHLPAYTSTSTNFDIAAKFAAPDEKYHATKKYIDKVGSHNQLKKPIYPDETRHVLKIHLPKGTKAASVKSHSYYTKENEILLHRGHEIEIHHKPTILPNGTHVWHARVIGHKPSKI